jgi:hypothetical protein
MADDTERFLDLSKVCSDLEDLLDFGDFVPVVDCPHCVEGWVPDPNQQPTPLEVMPGLVVLDITPVPCDKCEGTGWRFWLSEN